MSEENKPLVKKTIADRVEGFLSKSITRQWVVGIGTGIIVGGTLYNAYKAGEL